MFAHSNLAFAYKKTDGYSNPTRPRTARRRQPCQFTNDLGCYDEMAELMKHNGDALPEVPEIFSNAAWLSITATAQSLLDQLADKLPA
jgi:hypothetical protein